MRLLSLGLNFRNMFASPFYCWSRPRSANEREGQQWEPFRTESCLKSTRPRRPQLLPSPRIIHGDCLASRFDGCPIQVPGDLCGPRETLQRRCSTRFALG
jgi:hypothetical protein